MTEPWTFNRKLGWSGWAFVLIPVWLAMASVLVAACTPAVKPSAPQVVTTGCTAFPRLTASRQDTAQTREAILAYITTWDALCAPPATTGAKP